MKRAQDEKLVRRAQRGDKAAFAELFRLYEGRIYGYLYRMVGNRTWAEDLAQEAFIQAHQHLKRLGPPYDFKSWLYRIASNLAIDSLRRYKHEVALPDWDGGEVTGPEPAEQRRDGDPEDQAQLADVRAAVWRTIHQLSDNYRQILVLREIDGLSYNEIAAVLDISLDNVRVTLHRARCQFRDLYGLQMMVEEGRLACQDLDDLLSAYVDGELDRATRRRVKSHVESCPVCQQKRRDLLTVAILLGSLVPIFPPPTLGPRFLKRLDHLPPPKPVPAGGKGGGRPPGHGRPVGPRSRSWWPIALLGGAALLLLVGLLGLGLLSLWLPSPFGPPASPTAAGQTAVPSPANTAVAMPTPTSTPRPAATAPAATPVPPAGSPVPTTVQPTSPPPPPPPATPPPPSPTSLPTPAPQISFSVDASTVQAGSCTTIRWETAHVKAVYFDGTGVVGTGTHRTCPCVTESHTLDVLLPDDSHDVRTIDIQVTGSCATPTPSPTPSPPPSPTPDTQAPPPPGPIAPVGGVVLSCRSQVTLSWNPASDPAGIQGYYVRLVVQLVNQVPQPQEWGPVGGTSLSVPVSCGLGYQWGVQAEDGAGNRSAWSQPATFGIGID